GGVLRRISLAAVVLGLALCASVRGDDRPGLPVPGYPAGLPAAPLKDFTPAELLAPAAPGGDILPPPAPAHHEPGGFFAWGEYMLLRPTRGAFDYALVSRTTAPTPIGRLEVLDYDVRGGFRAAV